MRNFLCRHFLICVHHSVEFISCKAREMIAELLNESNLALSDDLIETIIDKVSIIDSVECSHVLSSTSCLNWFV